MSRPRLTKTILAVDDCVIAQQAIEKVLGDRYRVLTASTAKEALNLLYKQPIHLLVLDISMPDIDGFALCRTIRHMPAFENLPIVMLTSRTGVFDKVQSQIAGATAYLTKPFSASELQQKVEGLMALADRPLEFPPPERTWEGKLEAIGIQ